MIMHVEHRSQYYNNPDAKGFILYGQIDGVTVYEKGRGSSQDAPFPSYQDACAFMYLYGDNIRAAVSQTV